MKPRLYYLSNKKESSVFIELFKRYDKIRYILVKFGFLTSSCQYFSVNPHIHNLLAIP